MNDYNRIQQAVDYIEANLQEAIEMKALAAVACFSPFHFQRLFHAITGFTVQAYIRKRRLTEAARILEQSSRHILDVALAYQYQSQEAFSRAFESYFGMMPGKYRKTAEAHVNGQHRINLLDYQQQVSGGIALKKPKLVQKRPISIVGRAYETNLNEDNHFKQIPAFYHDFGRRESYLHIPNRIRPDMAYGISCAFQDDGGFTFIVGEESGGGERADTLEEGFVRLEIPEGTYAEFDAGGPDGTVRDIRNYIYGTWMPNSNYERTEGPDYEITDVLHSAYPDDLRIKIYIPIH